MKPINMQIQAKSEKKRHEEASRPPANCAAAALFLCCYARVLAAISV